jgi:hypothetical protein
MERHFCNSCWCVRLGALPAFCVAYAFSDRIFVACPFRGCIVLSSLTRAVGFFSVWHVRFLSQYFDSWNCLPARAENVLARNAAKANSCRLPVQCPALDDDVLAVEKRYPQAASAAT